MLFGLVIYCNYKAYRAITAKEPAVEAAAASLTGNSESPISRLTTAIQGVWDISGETSAIFIIGRDKVIYPEEEVAYDYVLRQDSIHVKFADHISSFYIHMRGPDTLVLAGKSTHQYCRFRESDFN
ncbi:MAG: hypothetical protein JST39_09000 [Bacteroidetes bacterium]|nr:hypothetical protein [Bacteroidota bacterium]